MSFQRRGVDDGEDFYCKDHFDLVKRQNYELELSRKSKMLKPDNQLNQEIIDRFDEYDE